MLRSTLNDEEPKIVTISKLNAEGRIDQTVKLDHDHLADGDRPRRAGQRPDMTIPLKTDCTHIVDYTGDAKYAIVMGQDGPVLVYDITEFTKLGVTGAEVALASCIPWSRADVDQEDAQFAVPFNMSAILWFARKPELARAYDSATNALDHAQTVEQYMIDEIEGPFSGKPRPGVSEAALEEAYKKAEEARAAYRQVTAQIEPVCREAARRIQEHLGDAGIAKLTEGRVGP